MLDYADLFATSSTKPSFSSSRKSSAPDADKDPFDDMMDDAAEE